VLVAEAETQESWRGGAVLGQYVKPRMFGNRSTVAFDIGVPTAPVRLAHASS
jgi:hypothetical protein